MNEGNRALEAITWVPRFCLAALAATSGCSSQVSLQEEKGLEVQHLSTPPIISFDGESESSSAFFQISAVQLLPDGQLVVADAASQTLRVYGFDGHLKSLMGGRGEGPGEFSDLYYATVVLPDTIVAFDVGALRATTYSTEGQLINTVQMLPAAGGVPRLYIGRLSDGSHAMSWIRQEPRDPSAITADIMDIVRFDADGQYTELLATAPGIRRLRASLPFSAHLLTAVIGDSVLFTDGLALPIGVIGDGSVSRTITIRGYGPRAGADDEGWEHLENAITDPARVAALNGMKDIPGTDSIPMFSALISAGVQHLWLKLYDPMRDSSWLDPTVYLSGGEWIVITRDGTVTKRIAVPANVRVMDVDERVLAGVEVDSTGVERIVLFEVPQ